MVERTRWRLIEIPCTPDEASEVWRRARADGAVGAVTSWGSGIPGRQSLRTYWEVGKDRPAPEGEDLVEENWTPFWRESFRSTAVTSRISLVPAWQEPPPGVACPIRIDPGMAFGAGDHPTTRLCLQLLEEWVPTLPRSDSFLDVGAGTGVLALAAACLGVATVDALDIDPFGYAACRRNALLNGLEAVVRPLLLSLDLLERTYPLVAANIVAGQLLSLADRLRAALEPEGLLILSGFEDDAEVKLRDRFGLQVVDRLQEESWVALALRGPNRRAGG